MPDEASDRFPVRAGDVVGGKYRVERMLGFGGMGFVVAATHTDLGQQVALKFILPQAVSGRDAIERFLREARAVARLRSEHVARVYDVGRDAEDRPYMVLELLEGEDLARLNKQKGPLPVADAIEYVLQACAGLVEAHAAGIVHRDLKPQNLFVTRRINGTPLVKLLDFGIAKAVGAAAIGQVTLTDSKAVIGSPLYMPPEQMRSARTADVRSDVWAVGVILYELVGGQLPFDGETVTEICVRVVNETPKPLLTLRPGLDPKLAEIIMRCLEKRPDARWQTIGQLGAALEPYARSSQQGGAHRPWQSFEDTMDSVDTAGSPSRPTTQRMVPSGPPPVFAQTDVTWGEHSDPRVRAPRGKSFATGLVVGALLSLGAIGAAVAVAIPRLAPREPTPPSAPAVAAPASSPLPTASQEPPPAASTASLPSVTPSSLPTTKRKRPPPSPAASIAAPSPLPSPSPSPAPSPEPKQEAPNGAPILR